ncbi:hypothetical protein D9M71_553640 [compost metagenome]
MACQQGQAKAGNHAFALGIGRSDFQRLGEMHAFVLEVLFTGLASPRTLLANQQGMRLQVLQAQALKLAKRMVGRRDGNDRIVQEGYEFQSHVLGHHGHDDQIVTVVREPAYRLRPIDHGKGQVDFRVLLLEGGEQMRDEILGTGFHGQFELTLQ